MEFTDGALCLNDIRSMRLAVNDLLKWVRTVCPKAADFSVVLYTPSPSTVSDFKMVGTSTPGSLLPFTTTAPMTTTMGTTVSTELPDLFSGDSEPIVAPELIEAPVLDPSLGALVTLWASLLGAWLAIVMLGLTWMRLTDLRYKSSVVSKIPHCEFVIRILILQLLKMG